jgi:hypothetical protein
VAEINTGVPEEDTKDTKNELWAAIILGIAATVTALAAWQGGVAGGDASVARSDAAQHLADANFFYARENQTLSTDQELFVAVVAARTEGNVELEAALTDLMSLRLEEAIAWWDEQDHEAVLSPFQAEDGNPYYAEDPESDIVAADTEQQASDDLVAEAEDSDAKADKFDLSTVILALTLFFAGIATLLNKQSVQMALLAISAVTMVIGLAFFIQGYTA